MHASADGDWEPSEGNHSTQQHAATKGRRHRQICSATSSTGAFILNEPALVHSAKAVRPRLAGAACLRATSAESPTTSGDSSSGVRFRLDASRGGKDSQLDQLSDEELVQMAEELLI